MIEKETLIKYLRTPESSPDFINYMNEYLTKFKELTDYERMVVFSLTIDYQDDITTEALDDFFNILIDNNIILQTSAMMCNTCFLMDNKDVGCYVKYKDKIFKVSKREDRKIKGGLNPVDYLYDESGNEYYGGDCVPSSLKELREQKLKMLN